ncbi:MAG: D-glycero-alpha-D-manno-heptose-1,7-bisphosphate 7-phosphatase [Acidobacteriota bacterium]
MTERPRGDGAVFLDRDGTIVEEVAFLHDRTLVRLIPGAAQAIRRLNDARWPVVMISNQSGIARGLYTVHDFFAVQRRIDELLRASGAQLDGVFFCPHHPDFTGPCDCRKPGTRLFHDAATQLGNIDLAHSWYVGDRVSDVIPALTLEGHGVLVQTGPGSEHAPQAAQLGIAVVTDLTAAVAMILS